MRMFISSIRLLSKENSMHRLSRLASALIFLLAMGCTSWHQLKAFHDARGHMLVASIMENAEQYHEAELEYIYVARNFPASRFYKTAVFKAAMLSGRKDNPKRNLSTSLYWLNEYRKLSLSAEEQEIVNFLIALIEQNEKDQNRISQFQAKFENQRALISQNDSKIHALEAQSENGEMQIQQLQKKLAFYEEQIKFLNKQMSQLNAEIAKKHDELRQLKEIDLRIHQNRLK